MKIINILSIFLILGAYSGLVISCHSHDGDHTHESHEHSHGDHDHSHDDGDHTHDTHAEEGQEHDHGAEAAHGEGAAFTSAYVCPMHCEGSGSEKAGECPVCGMDYVALAEHTKDGHTH